MASEPKTPRIRPFSDEVEYLYSRVQVVGLGAMVLGDGCVRDDTIIFKTYAASRVDGTQFAADLMTLGLEIQAVAGDMRDFVKTYESEKWED